MTVDTKETGETIEITFSWAHAARIYAVNLREGEDAATRLLSADEVWRMGQLLDDALAFIESEGNTAIFKAYRQGAQLGRIR